MWIEFDDSLSEKIDVADERQCAAIESIALSAFYGRHIMFAKTKTIAWISRQGVSSVTKAVCKKIKSRYSELSSIRSVIGVRLVVMADDEVLHFNNGTWFVSISTLSEYPVQFGLLLAENLNDALIYLLAAEHYKISKGLKWLNVELSPDGGGGTQIYPRFENSILKKSVFCLAITDTDKDFPTAASNITSQRCRAVAMQRKWIADHFDVPARELENILPINLVEDAIYNDTGAADLHGKISSVKSRILGDYEPILYCDLKLGTKFSWTKDKNIEKSRYWKAFVKSRNIKKVSCGVECEEECKCFMIDSLGETVAEKFFKFCAELSPQKQYERVKSSENCTQWLAVGKAVFDWGVALPKSRN